MARGVRGDFGQGRQAEDHAAHVHHAHEQERCDRRSHHRQVELREVDQLRHAGLDAGKLHDGGGEGLVRHPHRKRQRHDADQDGTYDVVVDQRGRENETAQRHPNVHVVHSADADQSGVVLDHQINGHHSEESDL